MNRYPGSTAATMLSSPTRRRLLLGLAAIAPAVVVVGAGTAALMAPIGVQAASGENVFLEVSRIITGNDGLADDVAQRIQGLLVDRIDRFSSRLDDLFKAMNTTGGSRDSMLKALNDDQVAFSLDIARPWYLGYVGTPSDFILDDDAAFATFLDAQSWEKIIDKVPRPTYPTAGAGWWDKAPPDVDAPPMPEDILRWTFYPDGPAHILTPDPQWKSYATADHASIEKARSAKPGSTGPSDGNPDRSS